MDSGEIMYEKVYASPRPPPKISFKDNWMKELGSEVAGGSEDSQQTQAKIRNPIVSTVRPSSREDSSRLQQNNVYNPFSDDSKAMIREMGNVELFFKLCETIPKVQYSECLLYWNQGVNYCTCGNLLVESESSQHFSQWRPDALSIPHYVIKKERPHGARHGKTDAQKKHFVAHNARRRCLKNKFEGIHDHFQRDPVYRDSQLKIWLDRGEVHRDG